MENQTYDRSEGTVLFLDGKYTAAFCHFLMGADTYADARSASFVAYMYEFGFGIRQSYEKAHEYYLYGMDGDFGEAAYNLAIFYFFGLGTAQSYPRALEYMEKSAEMGCIEAQLYLAGVYLSGYLQTPSVFAVTTLPYHKPLYDPPFPLLDGYAFLEGDDERITTIIQSESDAMRMLTLAAAQDEAYAGRFIGDAKYLLAQARFAGLSFESNDEGGSEIDRMTGEQLLLDAAKNHGSMDAQNYILTHKEEFLLPELKNYMLIEDESSKI
ncbi:MAG: sel1 repeat family protein [Clostridia bacterium]|nr:sel1 repeat family protein [Clostridia bacterium]